MPMFHSFALLVFLIATFCGCTAQTEISIVRISDPDVGISLDVPVQADGTFSQEMKRGDVVSIASGKVSDESNTQSVRLSYERRLYTAPGKFESEKLETEFKTTAGVEVPIGKNPSTPKTDPSTANNGLTNLTITLIKGEK